MICNEYLGFLSFIALFSQFIFLKLKSPDFVHSGNNCGLSASKPVFTLRCGRYPDENKIYQELSTLISSMISWCPMFLCFIPSPRVSLLVSNATLRADLMVIHPFIALSILQIMRSFDLFFNPLIYPSSKN